MNENLARTYRDSQRELWAEVEALRAENAGMRDEIAQWINAANAGTKLIVEQKAEIERLRQEIAELLYRNQTADGEIARLEACRESAG